jgi:hypothetical protein
METDFERWERLNRERKEDRERLVLWRAFTLSDDPEIASVRAWAKRKGHEFRKTTRVVRAWNLRMRVTMVAVYRKRGAPD